MQTEGSSRHLTVIVPVYNEERVLPRFHEALCAALDPLEPGLRWGVLYVADPGTDGTEAELERLVERDARASALVLSRRFGHQAALLAGMDHVPGGAVAMMDGDLQHPPELLPRMLERLAEGFDVVSTVREPGEGVTRTRRWASDRYYAWINRLSGTAIPANAADFRAISERVLRVFQTQLRERNQFLRGLFVWIGFRQTAVRFRVQPRAAGAGKFRGRDLAALALRSLVAFSRAPLRLASVLGLLCTPAGLLLVLGHAAAALAGGRPVWGPELLAGALVVLAGVQLLCLVILGEYVAAVLDEVRARPHYLVGRALGRGPQPEQDARTEGREAAR